VQVIWYVDKQTHNKERKSTLLKAGTFHACFFCYNKKEETILKYLRKNRKV